MSVSPPTDELPLKDIERLIFHAKTDYFPYGDSTSTNLFGKLQLL